MNRNRLGVLLSLSLVVGLAAAISAQAPFSNGQLDEKTIQSIRVKVIGCVAVGTDVASYLLTHAFLSGDDIPSTAGTAGKIGDGKDVSFEDSRSFDLIGDHLEAHVGHQVEVIGITSDTKLNNSDAFSSAIGSSTRQTATLTVSAVKMIALTCP